MRCKISVADEVFEFVFQNLSREFLNEIYERYSSFLTQKKTKHIVKVTVDSENKTDNPGNLLILSDRILRKDFTFNLKSRELKVKPSIYSFDSFLRIYLSELLNDSNGFLIHACGVYDRKNSFVFIGKSGWGKTTLSSILSNNYKILSDEIIPVKIIKDSVFVYSSPFWGNMRKAKNDNVKRSLTSSYILKKSKINKVIKSEIDYRIRTLLKCILNFNPEKHDAKLLNNVFKFLSKTNLDVFCFRKDIDVSKMSVFSGCNGCK